MVKFGFLFSGSDCVMPHIVQGSINIFIIHAVDFLGTLENLIIVNVNMKRFISRYKHLF